MRELLAGLGAAILLVLPWGKLTAAPLPNREMKELLIPMKAVTDSDLIPGSDSDAMPVTLGAKRRW